MREHRVPRFGDRRLVDDMPVVRSDRRTIAAEDDVAIVPSRPSLCSRAKGDDRVVRRGYDDSQLIKLWVSKETGVVITFLELPKNTFVAPAILHMLCPKCGLHYLPIVDTGDDAVH
jgi:hypothetical protein